MIDLSIYLSPEKARNIVEGSIYKSLASLALRRLWHRIFDSCPKLLRFSELNDKSLFENFLEWADDSCLLMDWTLHFHLLNWLYTNSTFEKKVDDLLLREVLSASANYWAIDCLKDTDAKGIILASPRMYGFAIGAWRPVDLAHKIQMFILRIPNEWFPEVASYALSYKEKQWGCPKWIKLS